MVLNYFDEAAGHMKSIPPGSHIQARSTFMVLRDAKVIFDGTVHELVNSPDEYIREYIA